MTTPDSFIDEEPQALTLPEIVDRLGDVRVRAIGQIGLKEELDPGTGKVRRVYDPDKAFTDTIAIKEGIIQDAKEATGEIDLSDIRARNNKEEG